MRLSIQGTVRLTNDLPVVQAIKLFRYLFGESQVETVYDPATDEVTLTLNVDVRMDGVLTNVIYKRLSGLSHYAVTAGKFKITSLEDFHEGMVWVGKDEEVRAAQREERMAAAVIAFDNLLPDEKASFCAELMGKYGSDLCNFIEV